MVNSKNLTSNEEMNDYQIFSMKNVYLKYLQYLSKVSHYWIYIFFLPGFGFLKIWGKSISTSRLSGGEGGGGELDTPWCFGKSPSNELSYINWDSDSTFITDCLSPFWFLEIFIFPLLDWHKNNVLKIWLNYLYKSWKKKK